MGGLLSLPHGCVHGAGRTQRSLRCPWRRVVALGWGPRFVSASLSRASQDYSWMRPYLLVGSPPGPAQEPGPAGGARQARLREPLGNAVSLTPGAEDPGPGGVAAVATVTLTPAELGHPPRRLRATIPANPSDLGHPGPPDSLRWTCAQTLPQASLRPYSVWVCGAPQECDLAPGGISGSFQRSLF